MNVFCNSSSKKTLCFQQAHWPSHMSTCAQNQANQDEDGNGNDNDHGPPGATSGPGAGHEAVQHFLANSQAGANGPGGVASSRSNGLGPQAARGIQVRQVHSQVFFSIHTLTSLIDGYTHLLIFRKFSTLPAVIWAFPFINFKKISSFPVFSPTQMSFFPLYRLLLEPPAY